MQPEGANSLRQIHKGEDVVNRMAKSSYPRTADRSNHIRQNQWLIVTTLCWLPLWTRISAAVQAICKWVTWRVPRSPLQVSRADFWATPGAQWH